jgi:hypothetical protein
MFSLARPFSWLLALTMFSATPAVAGAGASLNAVGTPDGFAEMTGPRVGLVDVYSGGRKVSEATVLMRPGILQFRSPDDILAKLPDIKDSPELKSALAAELPTNAGSACVLSNMTDCGSIDPQVIGIVYDEEHFRVDIFVNPKYLKTVGRDRALYLPAPDVPLSLTNSFGLAASGSLGLSSVYNIQNRTIIGFRNARLRANTSVASHLGLVVDDLVAEIDAKKLRYSAGLFWGPGNEFIGQRRIIGAGVGTQFDTFLDEDSLQATPLILFLAQPARVELLVDGRLLSSRSYGAGNNDLETSGLPSGSYPVLLRIHEPNGTVREERRFFVKNDQIAPEGHPIFYAYGGLLANTRRHRPVSASNDFYYHAGAAWRLSNSLAADVTLLGTQHKGIVEAGGWLIAGPGRFRAAGLVSSAGDTGALLQGSTNGYGPLSISFDLRRIWSKDGKPLIPLPSQAHTFDVDPQTGVQLASGSYTQATASLGLRLGDGFLSLVGSYRKDRNFRADYTIGPSVNWPILTRGQAQIVLEASAQRTRTTTAGFAGFRLQLVAGPMSVQSRLGGGFQGNGGSKGTDHRIVSTMNAQYSHRTAGDALVSLEGGYDRAIGASTVRGAGTVNSELGNLRAELLHNLEGRGDTQYDLSFQSGIALGPDALALGARDMEQSAMVVSVDGDARDAMFDVLVDEVVRGRVKPGRRLSLFVPAYRTYKVRLMPMAASAVSYDSAARDVTLYPGNVEALAWEADNFVTIFAQAVSAAGARIANARVETPRGIAETDANGYFQADVRKDDSIKVSTGDASTCTIHLPAFEARNDFASIGKVVCQ